MRGPVNGSCVIPPTWHLRSASDIGVLRAHEGLTVYEIEEAVVQMDPQISPRSVGGELRRMKGKIYRQEGKRWFATATAPTVTMSGGTTGAVGAPAAGTDNNEGMEAVNAAA